VKIVNFLYSISRKIAFLPLVLLVAMMLLIGANVFTRYIYNAPITGTSELSRMVMVFMLLFMGGCAADDQHIRIDLLANRCSPKVRKVIQIVTLFLSLVIYAFLTWRGVSGALYAYKVNLRFTTLGIPHYPFLALLVLGFAIFFLVVLGRLIQRIVEVIES